MNEYSAEVTVQNLAPTIVAINGPSDPVQVGTTVDFTAVFSDLGVRDTHTALWDWGDSNSDTVDPATSPASITHIYSEPGVYTVAFTVSDDDGGVTEGKYEYVVVYDLEGYFVTGAGWINSPIGSYTPDPNLTGKATFGFLSKYKKGANLPTGKTEFVFKMADLNFQSNSYGWLVVTGNNNVQFKGIGTINGTPAPNGEAYKFMIWAGDGELDTFRIRVWYEENEVEYPVYDNGLEQTIGGGSNRGSQVTPFLRLPLERPNRFRMSRFEPHFINTVYIKRKNTHAALPHRNVLSPDRFTVQRLMKVRKPVG